ncbi:MAG: permease [Anaerolineales bacterium]|nr:MAG: permease [Anaerolineales bacterium]
MQLSIKKYRIHLILLLVILILGVLAFRQGGWIFIFEGVKGGITILFRELLLLTAAFLTAGLLQALVRKEFITKWLGRDSGLKGILLACLGGGLIPGGPYAYYPIAGALLSSGAGLGVLVAFVSAKNLWSVSRLPLEIAILGTTITLRRYLITFLIPPLLGILVEWLFGGFIQKIRENVKE